MRHKRAVKHFSRRSGPRKALVRGLVDSLVEHERIQTTLAKAKELRRHVEKAITKGKDGTIHARRVLASDYPNLSTVEKIVADLSVRFKDRAGGYTRIIKAGKRAGDMAEMALIEFVDYQLPKSEEEKTAKGAKKAKKKTAKKATEKADEKTVQVKKVSAKTLMKKAAAHRRRKRKLQRKDRQIARQLNA